MHSYQSEFYYLYPWILHVLVDVSGSVERDIPAMRTEIERFTTHIFNRHNPLDLLRLSCFSGYQDSRLEIESTPGYFQPANLHACSKAVTILRQWKSKGSTAIYDSVRLVHQDLLYLIDRIPYPTLNVLILITDGYDNDSKLQPAHMGFPNSCTHLAVIGVGSVSLSALNKLSPHATSVHHIDHFDDLFRALSLMLVKISRGVII